MPPFNPLNRGGFFNPLRSIYLGGFTPHGGPRYSVEDTLDGPDGDIYVPTIERHWDQLAIPPPTLVYPCQEASGNLLPVIGSVELEKDGTGHKYQQAVTGWSRVFAEVPLAATSWRTFSAVLDLGAGESAFFLAYMAWTGGGGENFIVSDDDNSLEPMDFQGRIITEHGGVTTAGSENHDDIDVIRPYYWTRDAENDASGLFTDLEHISGTHNEGNYPATGTALKSLGNGKGTNSTRTRFGLAAWWVGDDAAAIVSAGLQDKSMLTTLGWSLDY